ncbi:MAG: glycerophosphodiester phosphodiesterase [Rhodospirillales bacterium]
MIKNTETKPGAAYPSGGKPLDPRVFGHRGAAAYAPENTLASFRKAAELGCQFVEFDVVLTRDGHPVVFHDNTLDRTTDGTGAAAAATLAELSRLDAGAWFGAGFRGEPLPTLHQVIECLRETGMGANVEIKPASGFEAQTGAVTAQVLTQIWPGALPPPLMSSYSQDALAAARDEAPQFPRAFLVKDPASADWETACAELECASLHVGEKFVTPELIAHAHEKGLNIRAYTVNDPARAEQLFEWGIDGVFSDAPDRVSAVL